MPSTYTLNNGIEIIATGEQSGTWGDTTNTNFELVDTSLDGQVSVTLAATGSSGSPNTLPVSDGAASNGRNRLVIFGDGGDLGGTVFVQLTPNDAEKIVYVRNNLSGSRSILLFQGTYNSSNDYEVPAGTTAVVFFNGAGSGAVAANVFNNAYFDAITTTTVDTTNIEVTNLKAKDGTAAGSIADSSGVVTIASSVLTTADINGGTVDGAVIGGASAAAGTFTTANATTVDTTNIEVTNLKAKDGTAAGSIADSSGVVTIASSVLTTADINGGTVDGITSLQVDGTMILDVAHPSATSSLGIGTDALEDSSAISATAIGVSALKENTTGNRNTAVGNNTLRDNTDSSNSTAVGYNALALNNGPQNQAFGAFTLDANTTGTYNTAMGYAALGVNVSGDYNVAIGGRNALLNCVSGFGNVAIGGYGTLQSLDDGDYNVVVGYFAGLDLEGGDNNVLIGRKAGDNIVDASSNTCVGYNSGTTITSGAINTCVGFNAGTTLTTGSNNTLLGRDAAPSAADVTNEITLGSSSVATLRCQQTSISALSDARDKDEIQDLSLGLDYIQQVRPVEFVWQMRDGAVTDKKDFGFIAQEMMAVEDANDAEWVSSVLRTNPERLEVAPAQLLPIAVKAIQELSAQIDELKAEVAALKG